MVLQMFIDDTLVDSSTLSLQKISDTEERKFYIQGAVNDLLERWSDIIEEENLTPEFYITSLVLLDEQTTARTLVKN